jgi:hypothetical protein
VSAAGLQIELPLETPPTDGHELLLRLRTLGLRDTERLRLTANRTVMVSFRARELRVHRGYLAAPREVHAAIVQLVQGRTRAQRLVARRVILAYRVPEELSRPRKARRPRPVNPRDALLIAKLSVHHRRLNELHFGGALHAIEIRLSDRMRTRLGHFAVASKDAPSHIAISRRHLRRHGWAGTLDTLLHEMVHQWQSEQGLPVDHRRQFRAKARAVGLAEHRVGSRAPSAERRTPSPSPLQSLLFWR